MPRVLLNKQLNMPQYFTEWIVLQKHRNKMSNSDIGEALGITSQAVGVKLRNNQYTFQDFIAITKLFGASDEELIKLTKI